MKLNRFYTLILITYIALFAFAPITLAVKKAAPKQILFKNVNIFNGHYTKLAMGQDVLVEGNLIKKIGKGLKAGGRATVIKGGGRTLMPGLIDNHVHLMLNGKSLLDIEANMTWEDLAIGGVAMAELYLKEGFTTVRDMGGANAGLNRAIKGIWRASSKLIIASSLLSI